MTRYLLDTNILLAYVTRKPAWQRTQVLVNRSAHALSISIVNEGEIKALADYRQWGVSKRHKLDQLLARTPTFPISGLKIVDEYARLAAQCRRTGLSLSKNDIWIAVTAIVYGRHLLTSDKDFIPLAKSFIGFTWIDPR